MSEYLDSRTRFESDDVIREEIQNLLSNHRISPVPIGASKPYRKKKKTKKKMVPQHGKVEFKQTGFMLQSVRMRRAALRFC